MALAYGKKPFTPPTIAVRMSKQLHDLAELWSDEDGDLLLWGWDYFTKKMLLKQGYDKALMPTDDDIDVLRVLSNRKTFVPLLRSLREIPETVGESLYVNDFTLLADYLIEMQGKAVLKAPWSSSGRGVRIMDAVRLKSAAQDALWVKRIIDTQGGIMVEPYYKKVRDFAMEFSYTSVGGKPKVEYLGLSLFRNCNDGNAYEGNIVAAEEVKMQLLEKYVDRQQIQAIEKRLVPELTEVLNPLHIPTPLGVDMMIVEADGAYKVHPCVEVNLRRTMGYLALKIYEKSVVNNNLKRQIENETDFFGYFTVNVRSGKWTVCKSGLESRQW